MMSDEGLRRRHVVAGFTKDVPASTLKDVILQMRSKRHKSLTLFRFYQISTVFNLNDSTKATM